MRSKSATVNDYPQIAVKVIWDTEQIGSGCLVWSKNKEKLYCITAIHCVKKDNKLVKNIKLYTKNETGLSYECKYILPPLENQNRDVAIFEIEVNDETRKVPYTTMVSIGKGYERYTINGFPSDYEGERALIIGEYNDRRDIQDYVVLNLDHVTQNKKFKYEQLVGISGAGCYVECGQNIAFWGIEIEVPNEDVSFDQANCVSIEVIQSLLKENQKELLEIPIEEYIINYKGSYRSIPESLGKGYYKNTWVAIENSVIIMEAVQNHFNNTGEDNILFIYGMSGIGKTRSVLEGCNQDEKLKNSIYYDTFNKFNNEKDVLINYALNSKKMLNVIIDDVSIDDWRYVNREFEYYYENFRILLIGAIPKNKNFNYEGVLCIEQSNESDVKNIINNTCSGLSDEIVQKIYDLSSKDLRLAILLSKIISKDIENSFEHGRIQLPSTNIEDKYRSAKEILGRTIELFYEREKDELLEHIVILSLFIDIGFQGNSKLEIDFLTKYFSVKKLKFSENIKKLSCIDLGIIKGDFFELSPRALARLAFEEEGWNLIRDEFEVFIEAIPTFILKKRFMDRVLECKHVVEKEVEEAYASWFQNKYAISDLSILSNKGNSKEFKLFTEYYPEKGLKWLKNKVTKLNKEDIYSLFNLYGSGRREIVWTCEHLANFEEYFFDCEEILFHLAQSETEKGISNNSQGIWSGLFSVDSSNTCVSFYKRLNLLMKRIVLCDDIAMASLFEKVFNVVLNDSVYKVRVLPPQIVGGKITPDNWFPKTYVEIIKCKTYILDSIIINIDKIKKGLREMIIDVVINNIRSYVRYNMLNEYKDSVQKILETQDQKNKLILVIDSEIGFFEYHKKEKSDAISIWIDSLLSWKNELMDKSLIGSIVEYLSRETWSYGHSDEQIENRSNLVINLCKSLLFENNSEEILRDILNIDNLRLSTLNEFGENLAILDENNIFKELVSEMINKNNVISFVKGYFVGNAKKHKELQICFLECLDECLEKNPQFSLWASIIFDINDTGYNRILNIVCNYRIVDELINMKYLDWVKVLSEQQKIKLLTNIFEQRSINNKYYLLLDIVEAWLIQDKRLSENFIEFVINLLENHFSDVKRIEEYKVIGVIKLIPNNYIGKIIKIIAPALDFNGFNYELLEYVRNLAKEGYTKIIINDVGEQVIQCYNSCVRGPAKRGYFDDFDLQTMKVWINEEPKNRAKIISYHLSSPKLEEYYIEPLTEYILKEFEDDEEVFYSFKSSRYNFVAYSLDDEFKNKENFYEKIEKYRNSNLKRIREWAEFEIERMKKITEEYIDRKNEDSRYMN